mgnify:CR=1 FL=1
MHAYLIVTNDRELRNSKIQELTGENKAQTIPFALQKIEDAKELKKLTKFSFSEKTAIIIENIDTATTEASNAFLKNLEEPSSNLIYILTAGNLTNVLPTIVSRCETIKIKNPSHKKEHSNINYKDALIIKDREEVRVFVENLIFK